MIRIEDIEERLVDLERSKHNNVTKIDNVNTTELNFTSASYYVDLEISVASTKSVIIEVNLNGVVKNYSGNFVCERLMTKKTNKLIVTCNTEGLLSKKIKIEGIGVKLLRA